jgi:glycosyltransferase involved in cell wall biosynthesis
VTKGGKALRILIGNKFWYRRGGQERVLFDEIAWLEDAGHEVAHYSTRHPENDPSPWSEYFAPYVEIGIDSEPSISESARAVGRMFWNREAAACFARLIGDFRPHLVHVHGIHRQISPSVLFVARKAGIPVVQTLHDYHPVCPADVLLLGDRVACQPPRCGRVNILPCVLYHCVHRSRPRSLIAGTELLWRRWALNHEHLVDAFIAPSKYLAAHVAATEYPHTPIHRVPNAVPEHAPGPPPSSDVTFVYAGRLAHEKGLRTLLRAAELARVQLLVAGDGPMGSTLRASASRNVTFLGRVRGEEVDGLLRSCRAAVLPSECVENAPMGVLEAMMVGRPVVATRMGGIPEQLRDGVDGLLVRPGDAQALAAALRQLADSPEAADRMGRAAAQRARELFGAERHTRSLLDVYSSVLRRPVGRPERSH